MQNLKNCNFTLDIELIELISGGNQEFEIIFSTKNKEKYKIIFDFVYDMRFSIENASIDRFYEFRKCLPEGLIENGIYIVENSEPEYFSYFEHQVYRTYPVDELKHYILSDNIYTTVDILTDKMPTLMMFCGTVSQAP